MKKFLLLTILSMHFFVMQAQDNTATTNNVDVGVKGGVNLSTVTGENTDYDHLTSFYAGLVMRYMIAAQLSLNPELYFGGHGFAHGDVSYRMYSLFLPVILTYYIQSLYIMAGPQLNFLLSANQKYNGTSNDYKDNFKKLQFGALLGLGYMLSQNLALEARYNRGLSNIWENTNSNYFNSFFSLGLVYMLSRRAR